MTKRAIIYTRVSTTGQAIDGVSLEMQISKAKAWCELNDYIFDESLVFNEGGVTGTSTDKREVFKQAMAIAQKDDAFIVYSISRFGRNAREVMNNAHELEQKGVDFVSITEKTDTTTPQGKFFFLLMAGMAQFTSDTIKKTTKDAMQHAKKEGRLVGGIPYGFDAVSTGETLKNGRIKQLLVKNDYEQSVITRIKELRDKGLSMQKISNQLHSDGFKPRGKSDTFQLMTIKRILNN